MYIYAYKTGFYMLIWLIYIYICASMFLFKKADNTLFRNAHSSFHLLPYLRKITECHCLDVIAFTGCQSCLELKNRKWKLSRHTNSFSVICSHLRSDNTRLSIHCCCIVSTKCLKKSSSLLAILQQELVQVQWSLLPILSHDTQLKPHHDNLPASRIWSVAVQRSLL